MLRTNGKDMFATCRKPAGTAWLLWQQTPAMKFLSTCTLDKPTKPLSYGLIITRVMKTSNVNMCMVATRLTLALRNVRPVHLK